MICVYCGKTISDLANYCGHCSSPVPRCPKCGRIGAKGIRFCEEDGAELPMPSPKPFGDAEAIDLDNVWIDSISSSKIGGSFSSLGEDENDQTYPHTAPLEEWEPGPEGKDAGHFGLDAVPETLFTKLVLDTSAEAIPEELATGLSMDAISETNLNEAAKPGRVEEVHENISEDFLKGPEPEPEKLGSVIGTVLGAAAFDKPGKAQSANGTAKAENVPEKPAGQKVKIAEPPEPAPAESPKPRSAEPPRLRRPEENKGTRKGVIHDETVKGDETQVDWKPKKQKQRRCSSCGKIIENAPAGSRICNACQKKQTQRKLIASIVAVLILLLLLPNLVTSCLTGGGDGETTPSGTGGSGLLGPTPVGSESGDPEEPEETKAPTYHSEYRVIPSDITWEAAQKACEAQGGTLATITSQEEYDTICALAEKSGLTYLWIGARLESDSDTWQNKGWITGEAWAFENWYDGEPSGKDTDGTKESYLCLWNAKYQGEYIGWTFNDQRNNILSGAATAAGKIGYVCEYQVQDP